MTDNPIPASRSTVFRAAIADFIDARREAKLKDREGDTDTGAKYDYAAWLADAAARASNLRVVTHPIKFTHSSIKGASSVLAESGDNAVRSEIGTHSVSNPEEDYAITDARHLDVYSLLKVVIDGKPIVHWLREDDIDLKCALDDDPIRARALMDSFRLVFSRDEQVTSHPLAKQIYWLVGSTPLDDREYQLLQPMFSSSLEHAVHEEIRASREAAFAARGTKMQKATFANHSVYSGLVARTIGGSNAQNVSPQNKVRGGRNYLLASIPPLAWKPRAGANLLKLKSVLGERRSAFFYYGAVRQLVRDFSDFLATDPEPNAPTRKRVNGFARDIADQLALFGADAGARHAPGWTRDPDCALVLCERLWLDPERSELPERDEPEHPERQEDDRAFNAAYARGDWPDEVATRFGLWLNGQLRGRGGELVLLGERQMRYFASQVILDVAWPIPLQRRAKVETP